jgi:ribonuclease BN (tRNA processing enzyme)
VTVTRRHFAGALLAGLAGTAVRGARAAQPAKTRLILLGTGGGPRPRKDTAASSNVIIVGDALYVVDCGDGVARQLAAAGVPLTNLRHVLITHHHSDHNADYGNLLLLAWAAGLRTGVDAWGPPPLAEMTRLFFRMNAFDIETRIADEGRVPLEPLVRAHEIRREGVVLQDERVKVTAALVPHPPIAAAYAYRFDTPDRAIVISGDTAYSENLIRLAKGAEVLVHEAMYLPAVDRIVARVPNAATLRAHLLASHTSPEDAGRVAQAAGVTTLVLSHLVPPDDPLVTDEMWIAAAAAHFDGRIIVAKDLMEL